MTVESFQLDASDVAQSIQITPPAIAHFAAQLKKKGKKAIRLSLKESGCTGFMYVMDEVDEPQAGDIERSLPDDVQMYIGLENIAVLKNLSIDYVQQGVNRNLVMTNPNVKHACGCGESFSV